MPSSMFFPLDNIQPSEILFQYSEWIYFTLVLVFFISIAGITLKRHFDKPYVKPLIISVGLMLTVGVFKFKSHVADIFEGWGILGTILLVIIAATIPYGLCRGFGMSAGKAFYLSYILIYIFSWVKFQEFYQGLADKNLGLVNFGLLILFLFSIFKVLKPRKSPSFDHVNLGESSPIRPEIDRDIDVEGQENKLIEGQAVKMTLIGIRSMEDIGKAIDEILGIIESHRNNLPREEREKIADQLSRISNDEDIFKKNVRKLQNLFQRLDAVDAQHFRELKRRFEKSSGKEKRLLKAEIEGEKEKIDLERMIFEFERKLTQAVNTFNQYLKVAIDYVRASPYPYDAIQPLAEAKKILNSIFSMMKKTAQIEEKLVSLAKTEKKLLKKEREAA